MLKYDLIPEQLLYENVIRPENLFEPQSMEDEVILLTHDEEYWRRLHHAEMTYKEMRSIGFPYGPGLIEREKCIMYGSVQAGQYALENGVAFNIAGGTHHAYKDKGEGFCIFNDIAVTINYLLQQKKIRRALVIDLDVHQGNGTAALFSGRDEIFTFSMHGKNNYPLHKEHSDLDIGLPDKTTDNEYLSILSDTFPKLVDQHKPDFIFYQSGVDILSTDKLGRMNISIQGIKERDKIVLEQAYRHSIPLVAAMGGGYSQKITDIVEAHCNLYRLAADLYS
jgi:acetoin utilization deacetylase AcuC-like enzyme